MKLVIAFPIAVFLDALDYIPVTYLFPGLLQFADVISSIFMFFLIGPLSFVGLVDLVPVLGLAPTFTILVIVRYAVYVGTKK
jgi:hypothetical protein